MTSCFSLVTGPTSEPISLTEAKAFLRITPPALSSGYAQAAIGANDIPLRNGGSIDNGKLAAAFVQSGRASIKSATLVLRKIGTLAAGKKLTLTLKADTAGIPGATLGTAGTVDIDSTVGADYGAVGFVFATAVDLAAGTRYHLELTGDYTAGASNQVQWRAMTVASTGNALIYDSGWAASPTLDFEVSLSQYEDAEDDLLASFISVARETVENFTNLALISQAWKYTAHRWPDRTHGYFRNYRYADDWRIIELCPSPLIAVQSVKYYPADGTAQIDFDQAKYVVVTTARPGSAVLAYGESWPALCDRPDAIEVNFTAGYASAAAIPAALINALKLVLSYLYDNRGAVATNSPAELMDAIPAAKHLLISQRVGGFIA